MVARSPSDRTCPSNANSAAREAAWIAEVDGRRVGCVFCVAADKSADQTADQATAQLRILLVDPSARGHHLGGRPVDECVAFARRAGYARMKLWTNDPLVAACHVYLSRGFALVQEEPHHSFDVDLVGQVYEFDLREGTEPATV
ncbi:GNAT family N-acetyltransferase [Planosporangium flavigriseum]|uniref:GNAT family N-acetyltransferase n=1 Tax=Planosporangium flavigriseum TaxID=373681 RepID=UPI001EF187AD|nr:GNAT family N-acetyltransferase [Planosporangium flavigriseum]